MDPGKDTFTDNDFEVAIVNTIERTDDNKKTYVVMKLLRKMVSNVLRNTKLKLLIMIKSGAYTEDTTDFMIYIGE